MFMPLTKITLKEQAPADFKEKYKKNYKKICEKYIADFALRWQRPN